MIIPVNNDTALRILRYPLIKTTDRERSEKSWWVWGLRERGGPNECYAITPLAILHRLFGVTVSTKS